MAITKIKAEFDCDIQTVWDIVTSLKNYSWRSDLSQIEILKDGQFIEYSKNGFTTKFTVTDYDLCRRYEFDMENDNMTGHWQGLFTFQYGKTIVEFTEDVTAKKTIMKPFVKTYLKKQQKIYINDLTQAIINL